MTDASFFLGLPKDFKKLFSIYPPTIEQILLQKDFSLYKEMFLISQEEIEDQIIEAKGSLEETPPTPLEFLLINCYNNKEIEKKAIEGFDFFIHEKVTFLYEDKKILIGDLEEIVKNITTFEELKNLVFLDENNYFDFQNMLRAAIGEDEKEPPDPDEDIRVKRIKAKGRYRDKIKAKKGMGISLVTSMAAVCCIDGGLTPLNVGKITLVALNNLMTIYRQKEKYQIDIDSLLAGADKKKINLNYWIKNFD